MDESFNSNVIRKNNNTEKKNNKLFKKEQGENKLI